MTDKNKNMRIASHNSWSYLTPTKWWMRLLAWTARCQRKNISVQHWSCNVDCFDLRVRFDKYGNLIMAHGLIEFPTYTLRNDLADMNLWGRTQNISCRVLLEFNKEPKDLLFQAANFKALCAKLQASYPHIHFFGFRQKNGGEKLFVSDAREIALDGKYSSQSDKWYYKYNLPVVYSLLNNRRAKNQGTDLDYLHLDFVEMG